MIKFLAIIPARSGSKGIPKKNIVEVAGKPLLQYTIEAAQKSNFLNRVLLSTDDKKIAEVGKNLDVEVPFIRPAELAQDDTATINVVHHTLKWLEEKEDYYSEAVVLLQPTSPLRTVKHIDEAIQIFLGNDADTVVSVVEVPHNYSPYKLMKLANRRLVDFWKEQIDFDRFQRHEIPKLYARNGPAILITKTDVILNEKTFYGEKVLPFIMLKEESIDIDDKSDLMLASLLLKNKNINISHE